MPYSEINSVFTAISFCIDPDVPMRIILSDVCSSFSILVSKSIFAKASNSFKTMSMLSVPIPVEITEIRVPFNSPVCVTNSLFWILHSIESKYFETSPTLSGSPTVMIFLAICSGFKLR